MPPDPLKIVLTPEALGEALLDPASQIVLQAWRDRRLQPVVSRSLLIRYFRLLRRLALPERLLRWWGYWLASAPKVEILHDPPEPGPLTELCLALASSAQATYVVTSQRAPRVQPPGPADSESPRWVTISDLVDQSVL